MQSKWVHEHMCVGLLWSLGKNGWAVSVDSAPHGVAAEMCRNI